MYKHPCAVMWKQGLEGVDGEAGQGLEGVGRGRLQGPETGCGGGKGIPCWAWALEGRSFLKEALPHAEVAGTEHRDAPGQATSHRDVHQPPRGPGQGGAWLSWSRAWRA